MKMDVQGTTLDKVKGQWFTYI